MHKLVVASDGAVKSSSREVGYVPTG